MQRRTRPSNIRRDTITGLPVIAPGGTRTGSRRSAPRVWNSLQRVLRPGTREQLTALIGIALLLVTGTTFAVTRGPYNLALNAHSSGLRARTDRASTAPPATPYGTPLPSGYGPTLSDVSTPVISSPPADVTGEFCQQSYMFVPNISQWTVPPGCYATIYTPNPANFASRPGFGYCNWWVNEQHLKYADITSANLPRSSTPKAGEAVWFNPGVQGASSAGHWAQLVAISPGGYWLLISEMNFSWRGAGFGKVDYRYIHVGAGILFVEG